MVFTLNFFTLKINFLCYTKFSFVKSGGGAFLLLLLTMSIYCQTTFNPIQLGCGRLTLEIVPKPYTGDTVIVNCQDCCSGTISCERIEYQVFLRATPGAPIQLNGNFSLDFNDLFISLKLNRVNAVISGINQLQTESCHASYLDDFTDNYKVSAQEDEVTLNLSTLPSEQGQMLPDIPFNGYLTSEPVFSVIVDGFPNETFGMSCTEFTYSSLDDGCTGDTINAAPALFPMPNTTNSAFTLTFGDINCSLEDSITIPIIVSSSVIGTINLLDFAIHVETTAPDGFYAEPEFFNPLPGTSPDTMFMDDPSGDGRVVNIRYVAQDATPFFGTDVVIGILRVYRPPNLCQGYTTSLTLVPGRIRTNGLSPGSSGCKAINVEKTTAECVVPPVDVCPAFKFTISSEPNMPECAEDLKAYATIAWDPADFNGDTILDFELLRARLDFALESGVTISSVSVEGFTCPSTGNTCQGDCLSFSGNSVDLCIMTSSLPIANGARIVVNFNTPVNCVKSALVRKILLKENGASTACVPEIMSSVGFPICRTLAFVQGNVATEDSCWVENVQITIAPSSIDTACTEVFLTGDGSHPACQQFTSGCLCTNYTKYTVTPKRNDNPLNGITTYDLVLISKHILGIEPLWDPTMDIGSPYKMIAADANKSNSITTFDIVEIRKLILGIYDTFPSNTSWRFLPRSYSFTYPIVFPPPTFPFPDNIGISALPFDEADFVAIKIGDVNNTVVVDCDDCTAFERPAGAVLLKEPRRSALDAGAYYTLPVIYAGDKPIVAWQTSVHFDPEQLELIGPSMGDAKGFTADNINLGQTSKGIINALWFADVDAQEEASLMPGQVLFNLSFRTKQFIPESSSLLTIAENQMPCLAWEKEGGSYRMRMNPSGNVDARDDFHALPLSEVKVVCRPNPSMGEITFDLGYYPMPKRAQLTVLDAFGRRVWQRDLSRMAGPIQVSVPEAANWLVGVYHWELRRDKAREQGTFIRQ